ncbi:hypothetical protein DSO57_1021469 [Entomophthora muscae]|uniref:Uncharacterized protein n=1 Tax=Entomophthora muscae TaxID=34485 RepID=A0ACC2UD70_9FUNG|nr:hypothetical protein DSO57_1021469 [Entomophthora muscae]
MLAVDLFWWAVKLVFMYVFIARCIFMTMLKHFIYPGPPQRSWAFLFHVVIQLLREMTTGFEVGTPIDKLRKLNDASYNSPPKGIRVISKEVPGRFRERAHQMIKARMQHDLGLSLPPVRDTHWSEAPPLMMELALPEDGVFVNTNRVVFMAHGGAYMFCSVNSYRPMACRVAQTVGEVTTSRFFPCLL